MAFPLPKPPASGESEKLTAKSLSEAVRERLLRLIVRGDLKPGERLNEVRLAESFGVSRGPLREAARELEGQGFLVSRPNQGFYVFNFTPREIRDIYEVKDWLEAAFIADVSTHMPMAIRKAILADIERIDVSDRAAFTESLFQFRLRVTAHIHNRFLADLIVALYRKFYIVSAIVRAPEEDDRQAVILTTLRGFWRALCSGDIAKAGEVMKRDTAYWLADLPPRFPGAIPPSDKELKRST